MHCVFSPISTVSLFSCLSLHLFNVGVFWQSSLRFVVKTSKVFLNKLLEIITRDTCTADLDLLLLPAPDVQLVSFTPLLKTCFKSLLCQLPSLNGFSMA